RQILGKIPAIVFLKPGFLLETATCIRQGAAAPRRRATCRVRASQHRLDRKAVHASPRGRPGGISFRGFAEPRQRLDAALPRGVHCRYDRLCWHGRFLAIVMFSQRYCRASFIIETFMGTERSVSK